MVDVQKMNGLVAQVASVMSGRVILEKSAKTASV